MIDPPQTLIGEDITPEDSVVPIYLVPLTAEEQIEQQLLFEEQTMKEIQATETEAAKQAAKESAIAKLAKLGLTAEEAAAIVGV